MYVLTALTGRKGKVRRLHYWMAVLVFALVNGAAYRIGVEMVPHEQLGALNALTDFLGMLSYFFGVMAGMWLWLIVFAFALVNIAAYRTGIDLVTNEQWGLLIALMTVLIIVIWLWVVMAVARSRDMGAPSYGLALFTLVPLLGWMPIVYLGAVADEAAEYNPD